MLTRSVRDINTNWIVCIHGWGCVKESFASAFDSPYLRDFSIYVFDLPGHGDTPASVTDDHSLCGYVDEVNKVINELSKKGRKITLVGHSMGGAIGTLVSVSNTNVHKFINVEGNLVSEDCGIISRSVAETRIVPEVYPQYWKRWIEIANNEVLYLSAKSLVKWCDTGHLLGMFNSHWNKSYVHGSNSSVSHILPRLSGTNVYEIPNAGHFPMMDNPEEFWKIVSGIPLTS